MKSMTILVDTREKNNTHLTEYWDRKGILHKRKALDYGDYSFMIPKNESLNIPRDCFFDNEICVERKGSAEELSGNLTKERDRLEKELSLAPKNKVILLENCSYVDIATGNYNTQYNKNPIGLHYIVSGTNIVCQLCLCQIINIQDYLSEVILNII